MAAHFAAYPKMCVTFVVASIEIGGPSCTWVRLSLPPIGPEREPKRRYDARRARLCARHKGAFLRREEDGIWRFLVPV
jgi:hypothetical protein